MILIVTLVSIKSILHIQCEVIDIVTTNNIYMYVIFFCLSDKRPPDARLALHHTPGFGGLTVGEGRQ